MTNLIKPGLFSGNDLFGVFFFVFVESCDKELVGFGVFVGWEAMFDDGCPKVFLSFGLLMGF